MAVSGPDAEDPMKRNTFVFHNLRRRRYIAGLFAAALIPTGFAVADPSAMTDYQATIKTEAATQVAADQWSGKRAELLARLEGLEAEHARLSKENNRLNRTHDLLAGEVAELDREVREAKRLESEIDGRLEDLVARLATTVATDLPFLTQERSQRIAMLEELLVDPDAGPAERLRRVMEALRIEADYGAMSEVTRETIDLGDGPVVADVLRLGRIAMFYKTGDGKTGVFDPGANAWTPLENKWEQSMMAAFDMADRRRAADIIRLPIGRIAPAAEGSGK